MLLDMGFEKERAELAVKRTGNRKCSHKSHTSCRQADTTASPRRYRLAGQEPREVPRRDQSRRNFFRQRRTTSTQSWRRSPQPGVQRMRQEVQKHSASRVPCNKDRAHRLLRVDRGDQTLDGGGEESEARGAARETRSQARGHVRTRQAGQEEERGMLLHNHRSPIHFPLSGHLA